MDFLNVFENIAFPIAVSVLLFWFLYQIVKKEISQNDSAMQIISEANKKHIEDLQAQNQRLSNIIAENTKAIAENTQVFKSLMDLIKYIQNQKAN
jgi:hypothetical protein